MHFIDFFSYECKNERERETEREWGDLEKGQKFERKDTRRVCLETAIKFSIDSLCPKFLHLSMHLSLRVT